MRQSKTSLTMASCKKKIKRNFRLIYRVADCKEKVRIPRSRCRGHSGLCTLSDTRIQDDDIYDDINDNVDDEDQSQIAGHQMGVSYYGMDFHRDTRLPSLLNTISTWNRNRRKLKCAHASTWKRKKKRKEKWKEN